MFNTDKINIRISSYCDLASLRALVNGLRELCVEPSNSSNKQNYNYAFTCTQSCAHTLACTHTNRSCPIQRKHEGMSTLLRCPKNYYAINYWCLLLLLVHLSHRRLNGFTLYDMLFNILLFINTFFTIISILFYFSINHKYIYCYFCFIFLFYSLNNCEAHGVETLNRLNKRLNDTNNHVNNFNFFLLLLFFFFIVHWYFEFEQRP